MRNIGPEAARSYQRRVESQLKRYKRIYSLLQEIPFR